MNNFTVVPEILKPVTDEEFAATFLKDRELINDWVGGLFEQNVFDLNVSLNHSQLTIWFGSWAIDLISESNFRAWTYDDHKDKLKWARIIWRMVHVYPLGFLISKYKFSKSDLVSTWNPAVESFSEYSSGGRVKMSVSNRYIHGATISQAIYSKIFGEITEFEENASASLALFDAFSSQPNVDNPLFVTLRRTLKKTLYVTTYPIPYFWGDFLLHLFGSIPSEFKELLYILNAKTLDLENFNINSLVNSGKVPEDNNWVKEKNNNIEMDAVAVNVLDKPVVEITPEKLFYNITSALSKGLSNSDLIANKKGAVIHKIEGHFFFVHPLWLTVGCEKLSISETEATEILNYAIANKKLALYSGHISIPKKTGFNIQLALLNKELVNLLPKNILDLPNNLDVKVVEKK